MSDLFQMPRPGIWLNLTPAVQGAVEVQTVYVGSVGFEHGG